MERAQAIVARDLEPEHAPGMLQPAKLASRPAHFHALLNVELVEAERGDACRRQWYADMGPELVDRGQVRQCLRVVDEVAQRHQRMGLAPAVRELELADGLGIPADETERHVACELAQGEGRLVVQLGECPGAIRAQRESLGGRFAPSPAGWEH